LTARHRSAPTLDAISGFIPGTGDTFRILEATRLAGAFSNVVDGRVLTDDGSGSFAVTQTLTGLTLSGFQSIAPLPEPASVATLALGAMLLGRRRRA